MFPLRLTEEIELIPEEILDKNFEDKEKLAKRLSDEKVKRLAEQNQSEKVSSRPLTSNTYLRDAFVAEYAKRKAMAYASSAISRLHFPIKKILHIWNAITLSGFPRVEVTPSTI